ncbi:PAS domain-containing protein [Paracoccus sp. NBH48]|uniref:PAS domain-containing protein n=1 Tax=Paracoccus sp. NBH48 TaxID=2596918 RepID=UPI00210313CD|nr:PAS domain-containing protein [Paracoccus sp. NBH48]
MNEELQSTNEELSTVNDELKSKIDDLTAANSDLQNFFSATKIPLLVVDRDVRVRNFTAAALQIFPLRRSDHGRPLADVSNVFASDVLLSMAAEGGPPGRGAGDRASRGRRHPRLARRCQALSRPRGASGRRHAGLRGRHRAA